MWCRDCTACAVRVETGVTNPFEGRVAPLVAHFSGQRKLSKKGIAGLRRLLDELGDG